MVTRQVFNWHSALTQAQAKTTAEGFSLKDTATGYTAATGINLGMLSWWDSEEPLGLSS